MMAGEDDSGERRAGAPLSNSGKDSKRDARQDRLKLALRQNLRRRKSQARGRDDLAASDTESAASYRQGDNADRE
jgi:hypothetical protein